MKKFILFTVLTVSLSGVYSGVLQFQPDQNADNTISEEINECKPFRTNQELWDYIQNPFSWNSLMVPLVTRCEARNYGDKFQNISENRGNCVDSLSEKRRPKVLVCHDMAGNYLEDRFISGSRKFDDYRFYHWAGIDFFNYFSHNYITIPPLPWINAGHRNGVPILGTIIVESYEAKQFLNEIIQSKDSVHRFVEAFVTVTKNFGFDGWLLNIEVTVDRMQIPLLKEFSRQLTKRIHDEISNGVVIWYDSVIESGHLHWQNEVNSANIDMYRGTDGILLNYNWGDQHLERTVNILNKDPEELARVFVGIDVFGRSKIAGFQTYETLRAIKPYNLSIGIFAPGWTFERIPDADPMAKEGTDEVNEKFLQRNSRFWSLLWDSLYTRGPNTLPFYTSFCLGSGKKYYSNGLQTSNQPWFNLMEQEYQPSLPSCEYQCEDAYHGGSCIKFNESVQNLRLFATNFSCKDNLIASYVIKRSNSQIDIQLILNIENENRSKNYLINCVDDIQDEKNINQKPNERSVRPLRTNLLKYTAVSLSNRREKNFLSYKQPINGWETRYYYLNFDKIAKLGRIVDIGINVNKENWTKNDSLLLGGLHIHRGIQDEEVLVKNLPKISIV